MSVFISRICINYDFAMEKVSEEGAFWLRFKENLPDECEPDYLTYRFTYSIFKLKTDSVKNADDLIKEAWEKTFPESGAISKIYTYEDGESDQALLMKQLFKGLYGDEAYFDLTYELYNIIPILKEKKTLNTLRMQNYLFSIDSGNGFTTMLSSFGDFLRRMNVFNPEEYDKRTQYIEYIAGAETAGNVAGVDDIIDHLMSDSSEITESVVGIDISYFLDSDKTEDLRKFIKRLYSYQNNYIFVFKVPFLEKKALDQIGASLSDLVLLRTLQFPPLHDCLLTERFWDVIRNADYSYEPSVVELFLNKVRHEKKDGRFYGFKTIEKIANEIVLKKAADYAKKTYSGEVSNFDTISDADIANLTDSDKNEKTGYAALADLIGMEKITERIKEIVAQVKVSLTNDKLDRPCIHMRFTGAPGTGKTTVARIIGQIFREEGILRKGAFLEYSARQLCGEYVGQTAVRTASICRDSYGSVLFIDEAYALYQETGQKSMDYGREALTTLIAEMENHRDDMLVVMAGYTEEMEILMKGNTGLRSRMPYHLNFENYTRTQLFEIFMLMVKKHFDFDNGLEEEARKYFTDLTDEFLAAPDFSNGRFVRNLYERTWSKGALRVSLAGRTDIVLTRDDFISASSEKEFSEGNSSKRRIGF